MHLNASLAREKRITPICNSHEQASAMCAESYAKAVDGLGVAHGHHRPWRHQRHHRRGRRMARFNADLFLSGQVKRPDRMFDASTGKPLGMRQLGVQEVDIVSIVKPITKYAVVVLDPSRFAMNLKRPSTSR